jgi:hypothetical protein
LLSPTCTGIFENISAIPNYRTRCYANCFEPFNSGLLMTARTLAYTERRDSDRRSNRSLVARKIMSGIMEVMTTGKFPHLQVVEDGQLVGIVSIGDVVKHRVLEIEPESATLRDVHPHRLGRAHCVSAAIYADAPIRISCSRRAACLRRV